MNNREPSEENHFELDGRSVIEMNPSQKHNLAECPAWFPIVARNELFNSGYKKFRFCKDILVINMGEKGKYRIIG